MPDVDNMSRTELLAMIRFYGNLFGQLEARDALGIGNHCLAVTVQALVRSWQDLEDIQIGAIGLGKVESEDDDQL